MKAQIWRCALFLFLLLCSACLYFYWSYVVHPSHPAENGRNASAQKAPTDLYPRWYGSRELLLHHRDPYSADVTREIQLAYDGKEQRFSYPLYVVFLFAPIVNMPFHSAQIIFAILLIAVTILSFGLLINTVGLRLSLLAQVTFLAMALCSIPVLQGVRLLQLGLFVAACLAITTAAVVSGRLFLAGMLLALATVKPPLSLLAFAWIGLWTSGDWHRRKPLAWGCVAMLAALVAASEFLVPGWLLRYPGVLHAYAQHDDVTPLIGLFLPRPLLWPVSLGALLFVVWFCFRVRRHPASSPHFLLTFALVLTLTVLIIPTALSPYNHVLLAPGILLIARHWLVLWQRGALSRALISLCVGIGILPWVLAPAVLAGLLMTHHDWVLRFELDPLYASLLLPFAVLGLLVILAKTVMSTPAPSGVPPTPESQAARPQAVNT